MRVMLAVIATWMICGPAAAQGLDGQQLDAGQLTSARGQLVTGGGLTFGFGAQVRTYIDGQLSLESTLSLTDKGVVTTTSEAAAGGAAAQSVEAAAAGGISLPGVDPRNVVVLPGADGATALVQTLTGDQISNIVLNTASNRDVRQQVDLTFVLPGFAETQALSSMQALRANIQGALDQALTQ